LGAICVPSARFSRSSSRAGLISLSSGAHLSSAAQTMVYFHLDTHVLLHRGVTAGAADHRGNPQLIRQQQAFNYRLAYTYIIGAAFWNFVGAGVFGGGTLNAPLINYYEHGTFLTLNHAHTALFGAFGLLAIGLIYFCLRYATADRAPFGDRIGLWAFWLYNGGLVLWILLNFFPIGWPQLAAVYEHGLAYAILD
jgi:hypothetical protein